MEIKNYCLIVLGDSEGVKDEILKIAETASSKPHYLDATGIIICTFSSAASTQELKQYFEDNGRSFVVFELDDETSGVYLENQKLHSHIFGYLDNKKEDLETISTKLREDLKEVSGGTSTTIIQSKVTVSDIENLSTSEKEELLNELLEKGQENWDENDIEIMKFFSKN